MGMMLKPKTPFSLPKSAMARPDSVNPMPASRNEKMMMTNEPPVIIQKASANAKEQQDKILRGSLGVDGGHVIDSSTGLSQFHVALLLAPVSRVQKSARLLQLSLKGVGLPLRKSSLLSNLHLLAELLLQERLSVPELSLVTLDGLVGLIVGLVGVV